MRYFCTYFDSHYLTRGLSLIESLRRHCPEYKLWILCFDEPCRRTLLALNDPAIVPIRQEEFEAGDTALAAIKATRTRVEYFFTCTPSLPLFVLRTAPEVDVITYLDADLYFFHSPEPIFEELGDRSIGIIGHRFTTDMRHLEFYGIYNVGMLVFRRDTLALECLQWWRDRCLEWCFSRAEEGRFGDQKYLNDWPTRFGGVCVLAHKGANVAVWNLANYRVAVQNNRIMVDEQPLIFFHFHRLTRLRAWLFDLHVAAYGVIPNELTMRGIFAPYFAALFRAERVCANFKSDVSSPVAPTQYAPASAAPLTSSPLPILGHVRVIAGHIMRRNYAVVLRGALVHVPEKIAAHFQRRHSNSTLSVQGDAAQTGPRA